LPDKPTFTSCFARNRADGGKATYSVIPYVYGGFLSSPAFFTNQIAREDRAPGGWDRETGRTTKEFMLVREEPSDDGTAGDKQAANEQMQVEYVAKNHLLGIDCSAFIQHCWGLGTEARLEQASTEKLPSLCLPIAKADLKRGDALIYPRHHVVLFIAWVAEGSTLTFLHAQGGSPKNPRSFRERDVIGRVVEQTKTTSFFDSYGAYSPFPQFTDLRPYADADLRADEPPPEVSVRVFGSGLVQVSALEVDGVSVAASNTPAVSGAGRVGIQVSWEPTPVLQEGTHTVRVHAVNRIKRQSFEDDLRWKFRLVR
jgi:hypothetical protein